MEQGILKVFFHDVQWLCISPLGAQFTKMATNGCEKAFLCVHFMNVVDPRTVQPVASRYID
jgi:hypothetical protein